MEEKQSGCQNNPSVIAHIEMLQGIIRRMAYNSAACKRWTVAIVSAMLTLASEMNLWINNEFGVMCVPTALFFFLDCYYLGLERQVINTQNAFVQRLNTADDISKDLFVINLAKGFWPNLKETVRAIKSFSTLPFYGMVFLIVYCLTHL